MNESIRTGLAFIVFALGMALYNKALARRSAFFMRVKKGAYAMAVALATIGFFVLARGVV